MEKEIIGSALNETVIVVENGIGEPVSNRE